MTDHITILTHSRSRLAKLWKADGSISGYDETKNYTVSTLEVSNLRVLSRCLTNLEAEWRSGVIRGKYKGDDTAAKIDPEFHQPGVARKIKALFDDVPLHWVLIEVDKFAPTCDPVTDTEAAIHEFITTQLPTPFHDVSYHWQLSSSSGHPSSAGVLKVHLWFWLARPATSDVLKQWARNLNLAVDTSVLNTVQLHYTAAPLHEEGVTIPVRRRSGFSEGLFGDEVDLDLGAVSMPSTALTLVTDDDLLGLSPTLDWTLEYAREVLFDINPDADRATWLNDLAALHHEFQGSEDALDLAVEWSSMAPNFAGREDVEQRWASFGRYRGGNPITGRWLLKRRTERLALQKYDAKGEWLSQLAAVTDEFTVREKLCPQIVKDERLDDFAREAVAQALFETFKRLGTKYPIAQCRKLIAEKRVSKMQGARSDLPEWARGWVYVTDEDQFYRVDSEEWLSMQGFNAKFNRELPSDEDGAISKSAAWVALEDLQIESVTKAVYLPWASATFELFGVRCVNTYRPSSAIVAAPHITTEGRLAIQRVLRHLSVLAGGRQEVVDTLVDWLAHNVQKPGVKIRWAPLIKGIEGDGKTLLGSLLAAVMGRVNVRNISPKVLGTDFTGWGEGAAVGVLEEIRLTGHSRHDILNALKPFVTNDSVEIHRKGKDTYDIINVTNYAAFTNFLDALPLTDTDRRWYVLFTPFSSLDELAAAVADVAPTPGAYFDSLHAVIQQHPAELRRWLLDHPISDSFKPNGAAPMTHEKTLMIGMNASDEEDTLRDLLDNCEGVKGVTKTLFSSRCVGEAMMALDFEISLNTTAKNNLFKKAGFAKLPKKVKWNGEAHTIWTKGGKNLEPDEVRAILDQTLQEKQKGSECDDLFAA